MASRSNGTQRHHRAAGIGRAASRTASDAAGVGSDRAHTTHAHVQRIERRRRCACADDHAVARTASRPAAIQGVSAQPIWRSDTLAARGGFDARPCARGGAACGLG